MKLTRNIVKYGVHMCKYDELIFKDITARGVIIIHEHQLDYWVECGDQKTKLKSLKTNRSSGEILFIHKFNYNQKVAKITNDIMKKLNACYEEV